MSSAVGTTPLPKDQDATGLAAAIPAKAERSLWSNAWREFRRNKMAMVGLAYLTFLALIAIFASVIAPHNPIQTDVRTAGQYRQSAWIEDANPLKTGSWDYPLGTDSIGRDVFSRMVYGTRISLVVGFIPMTLILLFGVPLGLTAGMLGGRVENLLMRFTDIVYAFPALLFFIIMQIAFGDSTVGRLLNGLVLLFITLSVINWTGVARLVRGETLSLKEKEFVEASRSVGAGSVRIIAGDLFPNLVAPIVVLATLLVPQSILFEAALSYLGLGVPPDQASWGQILADASGLYDVAWWLMVFPGAFLVVTTLAFNLLGDGLRDALDVRTDR